MGKRAKVVLAVLAVVLVGVIDWQVESSGEPSYHGRSLSYWIRSYRRDESLVQLAASPEEVATADDAIRHIGTNAFPYLLKWVAYDPDSRLRRLQAIGAMHDSALDVRNDAIDALERFGPSAQLAMPALVELVVPPTGFAVPSIGTVTNHGPGIDAATMAYIAAVIAGIIARDQWLNANSHSPQLHAARAFAVIDPAAASRAERSWSKPVKP